MRALTVGIILAVLAATGSIIWEVNGDVSALETWKDEHEKLDNVQFKLIREDLKEIKKGQKDILNHVLNY